MLRPAASWIDDLPSGRVIAEFSVWSTDLLRLRDELIRIRPYADVLHVDVADGHFAPACSSPTLSRLSERRQGCRSMCT
jgi:ribulose-phosphate 3-epimerase